MITQFKTFEEYTDIGTIRSEGKYEEGDYVLVNKLFKDFLCKIIDKDVEHIDIQGDHSGGIIIDYLMIGYNSSGWSIRINIKDTIGIGEESSIIRILTDEEIKKYEMYEEFDKYNL